MKEKQEIINAIAQFKADLLWDDIVGIFDIVGPEVQKQLEDYYYSALMAAALKLKISKDELITEVEEIAYKKINGQSYSQAEIDNRLRQYGINNLTSTNSTENAPS
jgi:hypothetical protein